MKKLPALTLWLVCAFATPAQAQVLGLLTLPELFGTGPCEAFTPSAIALFAAPDSAAAVGYARVEEPATVYENGGCEALRVSVHLSGLDSIHALPVQEYAYEAPAVVVMQQQERWFRIRLESGSAWLRASERAQFYPLEALLAENLTYIAAPEGVRLATSPGGIVRDADTEYLRGGDEVRVLEARWVDERLWLRVELLSHSVCEAVEAPKVVARGWVAAHTEAGEPMIWFFSRGC